MTFLGQSVFAMAGGNKQSAKYSFIPLEVRAEKQYHHHGFDQSHILLFLSHTKKKSQLNFFFASTVRVGFVNEFFNLALAKVDLLR